MGDDALPALKWLEYVYQVGIYCYPQFCSCSVYQGVLVI